MVKQMGYDSIAQLEQDGTLMEGAQIAVFDPNQIKSAEPVTRDEDGNVIPLSQRFDPTEESILRSGIQAPTFDAATELGLNALGVSPVDAPLDLSGIGVTAGSRVNTAQGREAEDSTFEAYERQDSYVINSVAIAEYAAFQGRKNLRGRPTQVRGRNTLVYKRLKALNDRRLEMFPDAAFKKPVITEIKSARNVSDALVKRIAKKLYVGEHYTISGHTYRYPPTVPFTESEAQMANVRGLIDFVRGQDKPTLKAAKAWKAQTVRDVLEEMRPMADEVYDTVSAFAVDNLVHLYDAMHPALRERAKLWYEGANRIAQDFAERYNLSLEQASTALAVLSPQKDWFQNVSLAGRVMEVVATQKETTFDEAMAAKALSMAENTTKSADESKGEFLKRRAEGIADAKALGKMMVGKTLNQLVKQAKKGTDTETLPARFVRVFDEINHPRGYAVITPEGNRVQLQTTKNEAIAAVGWGSYKEIQKAVNAVQTTDEAVHNELLGEQHKVRNFRNNIADPANANDGTIDTHAVSALYFLPVAGADTEVSHNFASSKGDSKISSAGAAEFGINGSYALNLKAHQDAAALINERDGTNLTTREIQSITWEQIRTLFLPEQKRERASYAKKGDKETVLDEARGMWDKTTDDAEARQLIEERFGGYGFPDWATSGEFSTVTEDTAYTESVRLKRLSASAVSRLSGADASRDPDGVGPAGVAGRRGDVALPSAIFTEETFSAAEGLLTEIRLDSDDASVRNKFVSAIKAAAEVNKSIEYDNTKPDDLVGAKVYLMGDGSAGAAITPEGDLIGVFDVNENNGNIAPLLEVLAMAYEDTFISATVRDTDGISPDLYHRTMGFLPFARVPSEDAPDVVLMGREDGPFHASSKPVMHEYAVYRNAISEFNTVAEAAAHRDSRRTDLILLPRPDHVEKTAWRRWRERKQQYRRFRTEYAALPSGIFGAESDLPSDFNDAGVDYSQFIELLELPLAEAGEFKKVDGWFKRLFVGDTDPSVQRFTRQRDAFLRTTDKMIEEYHYKYKAAIEKDYDSDKVPWEVIQKATGTTDNIDPDPDGAIADARDADKSVLRKRHDDDLSVKLTAIENAHDLARDNIKTTEPDPVRQADLLKDARTQRDAAMKQEKDLSTVTREAEEELADKKYDDDIKASFNTKKEHLMRERDAALKQIQTESPDLFSVLLDLRRLTDELSATARDLFGRRKEGLAVKFDNNMGLYVTRRYEMFSDTDYVMRILKSTEEADVEIRAAAIEFMRDQFIESKTDSLMKGSSFLSESDARAEAERFYNSKQRGGKSLGYQMISEFLLSYDTETGPQDFASAFELAGMPKTVAPKMSDGLMAITKNLEGRATIPKPLADLMGANNLPEDSVDNLLYAFATVSKIASHQSFLETMRDQGIKGGWLFTSGEHKMNEAKDFGKYGHYRQIISSGADSGLNPLAGLYVDPEIYESLKPMFQQTTRAGNDSSSKALHTALTVMQKATGWSMAAKTLGSFGFYLRNMLGNVFFFGPAQGYWGAVGDVFVGDPMKGAGMSAWQATRRAFLGNRAATSAYLRELEGLDVFGNEVRSEILHKLIRGEETFDSVQAQIKELTLQTSKNLPAHMIRAAGDTAARLAAAMDAFYKIGYYEHELAVFRKAKEADLKAGRTDGKYGSMSEMDLKREAAEVIGDTAQSYSRAIPIVKKISSSGVGLLIAPFIRFTAEVPRIAVNTVKRGVREINDPNSVIKARGYNRLFSFATIVGGLSIAIPTILRAVLADMGEEEDEAFRMSLPVYLRNHTFYLRKMDDGQLQSLDLTYLNPFSIVADPTLRFMEHIVRGEPLTAIGKLTTTAFLDPYLGDQILAGAILDVRENRKTRDDMPIFESSDSAVLQAWKKFGYVMKEAYFPRTPIKAMEALKAATGDMDSTTYADSPFGILFNETLPVRDYKNDPAAQFARIIYQLRDEHSRVSRRFGELSKKEGMNEGDVAAIHKDIRKSRMRINSKLSRAMRGMRSLGVSNNEMYQVMNGARYGKRRSQLLFTGFMENPVPTKNIVDRLMRTPQGQQRLQWLMREHGEHERFLRLDDD